MTADPTAPKIDTTRENAERIMWLIHESKAGREVRAEAFALIRALLDERDLAAAQTAAAVEAMREALAGLLALYEEDEGCQILPQYLAARDAFSQRPDATALDAHDQRIRQEVWEEAVKVAESCDVLIVPVPGMPDGAAAARRQVVAALRARASKEGER